MKALIGLGLCLLVTAHAFADVTVTPGSSCNAVLPGQARQLEWRLNGLINPADDKRFFFICPMDRQSQASDDDGAQQRFWGGALIVSALEDAEDSSAITCRLREVIGGRLVASETLTVSLSSQEQAMLVWKPRAVRNPNLSSFLASCDMPARTAVNTLVSVSSSDGDASYLEELEERF